MRAIDVIERERLCVLRASAAAACDRNCGECNLVMPAADIIKAYDDAIAALELATPKRVEVKEWKGIRDTRYKCPTCGKFAKNNEAFCHKCGQRLIFPTPMFSEWRDE